MNISSKKSKKGLVAVLIFLLLIIIAVGASVYFAMDICGWSGNNNGVYVEIREGATLKEIADVLEDEDIIDHEDIFYLYAKNKYVDFKSGGHVFKSSMSYGEICEQLCKMPQASYVKVLIPEGYEIWKVAEAIEKAGLVSAEDFIKSAENDSFDYDFLAQKYGVTYKLEGFLFPATYEFEYGTSAHDIIDKMLKAFDNMYTVEYRARARELGMTDFEVVTFASVVEREAGNTQEQKKVAGVFYNRIKSGMKLESCATVQYILKERKDVLSIADTKIDSPYNTYKYTGLPIGPVASPGKSAIDAVLYPEEHGYYYFVAKADGSGNVFSSTFEEHNRAIAENQ